MWTKLLYLQKLHIKIYLMKGQTFFFKFTRSWFFSCCFNTGIFWQIADFAQILEFEITMWIISSTLKCLGKIFKKQCQIIFFCLEDIRFFSVHPTRIRTNWVFSPFLKMSIFSTTSDKFRPSKKAEGRLIYANSKFLTGLFYNGRFFSKIKMAKEGEGLNF